MPVNAHWRTWFTRAHDDWGGGKRSVLTPQGSGRRSSIGPTIGEVALRNKDQKECERQAHGCGQNNRQIKSPHPFFIKLHDMAAGSVHG